MAKLRLYRMDMKYVRDLARVDDNVMSVSPQVEKANRPFVGVVRRCCDFKRLESVLDSRDGDAPCCGC
jgi:hypothetical protein